MQRQATTSPLELEPKSHSPSQHDGLPVGTIALAKALIGWRLTHRSRQGLTSGRIVEVEAYPPGDPASHAFRGRTPRNTVMFAQPHRAYVYFIYGNHWCFNVTSEPPGEAGGVLIRALEPLEGIALMKLRRGVRAERDLCRGPGRLCSAMGIDGSFTGVDLLAEGVLSLAPPDRLAGRTRATTRVGISRAAGKRLRFYEAGPFVSALA